MSAIDNGLARKINLCTDCAQEVYFGLNDIKINLSFKTTLMKN